MTAANVNINLQRSLNIDHPFTHDWPHTKDPETYKPDVALLQNIEIGRQSSPCEADIIVLSEYGALLTLPNPGHWPGIGSRIQC
jgi:hypothetical protein